MLVASEYKTKHCGEYTGRCGHIISFHFSIYFCDFATKYVNVLISTIHIHIIDNLFYSNGKSEFKTPILLNYLSLFRHS